MSILNYVDYHGLKLNKEHFMHLVKVAQADGQVDYPEYELLLKYGRNLGLTEPEIDNLMESPGKTTFYPSYLFSQRFMHMYQIIRLILVDGGISDSELRIAHCFAIASGFEIEETDQLILFLVQGIENGENEDELFENFRKKRFVN